jgi:hypothetical protein
VVEKDQKRMTVGVVFRSLRYGGKLLLFVFALFVMSTSVRSQDVVADEIAPPPLKILSENEKSRLAAETEVKRRTKLALELLDLRLKKAEALDAAENYDGMFVELGGFHGLMDYTLDFLNKSDKDSGRVLNNFKRFEIGLRGFTPRLEIIRRDLPIRYELYLRNLIKNLRAARARAIEPLFDDVVIPTKNPA